MVDSPPTLWQPIALVAFYLGLILLISELSHRYWAINSEVSRKIVHIGVGNVILLAWWFQIPAWVGMTAAVLASMLALVSYKLPILPGVNSIGRKSFGTLFYAVSMGLLVTYFWGIQQPQYAAIGILIMSYGDGMAAIIGQNWGKHIYYVGGMTKSWEGSLTMAVVSYIVCNLILIVTIGNIWQVWGVSLIVALVATGLESFSWWGMDNLTVPVGSAAIAYTAVKLLG
jgi:phytol kinase